MGIFSMHVAILLNQEHRMDEKDVMGLEEFLQFSW